jgi:hypothetical protein
MLKLQNGDWDEWQLSQLFTQTYTNQTTSWLVHSSSTFGARTNHGQTQIHKTHHSLDLGEATTFPLTVFSMLGHGACMQMSFCPRTPNDALPSFLIDSNVNLKWKQRKSKELGTHSLACNTLGWKGVLELQDNSRRNDKHLIIHTNLHKTTQQVAQCIVEAFLVLGRTMGKLGFTRFTMART